MTGAVEGLLSFVAAATFGLLFGVPRPELVWGGLVGAAGWLVYRGLMAVAVGPLGAVFAASFLVAALSQLLAVRRRVPVLLFAVPGIIPLVPGGLAYRTMLAFFHGEYAGGLAVGAQTLLFAGAIAAGLLLWTALFTAFRRRGAHARTGA